MEKKAAKEYFKQSKNNNKLHKDTKNLIKHAAKMQLLSQGNNKHNEQLMRLEWLKGDLRCQIGIFSDKLLTRLLAQFRAIDFKENSQEDFVPIAFYLPKISGTQSDKYFPYSLEEQQCDVEHGLDSVVATTRALAIIVDFYNKHKHQPLTAQNNFFQQIANQPSIVKQEVYYLLAHPGRISGYGRFKLLSLMLQNDVLEKYKLEFIWDTYLGEELPAEIAACFTRKHFHEQLESAAKNRQTTRMQMLLNKQLYINHHGESLHIAVKNDCFVTAELLLKNRVDINKVNAKKQTPLDIAITNGKVEMVRLLLVNGADANYKSRYGWLPLNLATYSGNCEIVKLLLDHGAAINEISSYGDSAITFAITKGHLEVVKLLLMYDSEINDGYERYTSPLNLAIDEGNVEMVKLLLANGAHVNQDRLCYSDIPLHRTVAKNNYQITKVLLEHRADPNKNSMYGYTPLNLAKDNANDSIVKLLQTHKAVETVSPRVIFQNFFF